MSKIVNKSFYLILLCMLTSCNTGSVLDKNFNLKYANSYEQDFCPTSYSIYTGSLIGSALGHSGGASLGFGFGALLTTSIWMSHYINDEIDCGFKDASN